MASSFQERFKVIFMRKARKFLAMALAVVLSMSVAVPAFAAEATPDTAVPAYATEVASDAAEQSAAAVPETPGAGEDNADGVMPLIDYNYTIGPDWKTVISGDTDLSGKIVRIDVHDFSWALHQVNVRYFRYGVELPHISEYDNVTKSGSTASVVCAAGATEMQVQIVPRFWGVQNHWYHVSIGNY